MRRAIREQISIKTVDINKWIFHLYYAYVEINTNSNTNNKTVANMVHSIVPFFTKNLQQLIILFNGQMSIKLFCLIMNYNEGLFGMNENWGNQIERDAVVDFIIKAFERAFEE